MKDLTVIYYTSNQEHPRFEGRIQRSLRHASSPLPIVSVSQKPIDFGKNICVGDVGVSSHNAWRQLQIGAMAATTKYVCAAEADCIYPKEYFRFVPPREDMAYMAMPLYVLFNQRGKSRVFCEKSRGSESAMVVGRECLIDGITKVFEGYEKWGMGSANGDTFPYLLKKINHTRFLLDTPAVTFKTDNNMHRRTPHNQQNKLKELPGLGNVYDIIRKYCR